MKALTIWQPWASLIVAGAKPFEWRRCPAPASLTGTRIVIHAGARRARTDEIAALLMQLSAGDPGAALDAAAALPLLERWHLAPSILPLACGLGTAILGEPQTARALHARGAIAADPDEIDPAMWGWPLTAIERWEPVVPCRGALGFWDWPGTLGPLTRKEP